MVIHLPEGLENSILAAVQSGRYASLDDAIAWAASLLVQRLEQDQDYAQAEQPAASQSQPALAHRPIWEEINELTANIPDEDFLILPVDGAEQLDHYSYALPKRSHRHEPNRC